MYLACLRPTYPETVFKVNSIFRGFDIPLLWFTILGITDWVDVECNIILRKNVYSIAFDLYSYEGRHFDSPPYLLEPYLLE